MSGMRGVPNLLATLKRIGDRFPDKVLAALYHEGQVVMTDAKRRTPVAKDGGTLRASGRVHPPERHGRRLSVLMSFGGAADAYAIAVHETPSEHDPPSWVAMYEQGGTIDWTSTGTGPKFLEGAINDAMPDMTTRLAARIKL